MDHAARVQQQQIGGVYAQLQVKVGACDTARSGTVDDHPQGAEILAGDLGGVEQRGAADDGRAVLVVVKDRDADALAQFLLHVEALGCLNVF